MDEPKVVYRVHDSWLAAAERRLLVWIASRLPGWVTPDGLTGFGLAGAALCGLGYLGTYWSPTGLLVACLGIAMNWFGDSLDGSLARVRKIERPQYGFFIDHNTDIMSQVFIFFGLGLSPYMRFDTACLCLLSYWVASLYTFIRAVSIGMFQISYFGIGPTEIRIALATYTLGGAWVAHAERERGSLAVGKLADFAVLSEDYMSVPVERIGALRSLMTVVGGRVV